VGASEEASTSELKLPDRWDESVIVEKESAKAIGKRRVLGKGRRKSGVEIEGVEELSKSTLKTTPRSHSSSIETSSKSQGKQPEIQSLSNIFPRDKLAIALEYPITLKNFPPPISSRHHEQKRLSDYQVQIRDLYLQTTDPSWPGYVSDKPPSAALHFKVISKLLQIARFGGLHFQRFGNFSKIEIFRRHCARTILNSVLPEIEKLDEDEFKRVDGGLKLDQVAFKCQCIRVEALMIKGDEEEALKLLEELVREQGMWEKMGEDGVLKIKEVIERKVWKLLSEAIEGVLGVWKLGVRYPYKEASEGINPTGFLLSEETRSHDAINPSSKSVAEAKTKVRTAERAMSWFFSRPEIVFFNSWRFPKIRTLIDQHLRALISPTEFLESLIKLNQSPSTVNVMARSYIQTLLCRYPVFPAFQCWELATSDGIEIAESVTRNLIRAASITKQIQMVRRITLNLSTSKFGSSLEAQTYLTLIAHCARFGDQVGLEKQVSRLHLYHGVQSGKEDFLYESRCLGSAAAGDSDRLLKLLSTRFDLSEILPSTEQHSQQQQQPQSASALQSIDLKTASWLIRCYVKSGNVDSAQEVFEKVKVLGLSPPRHFYNLLLEAYSSKVDVPASLALVDEMKKQGVKLSETSYRHLIRLFAKRKDPESAQRAIEAMKQQGIKDTLSIHLALLNAFVEAGHWDSAIEHFERLEKASQSFLGSRGDKSLQSIGQAYHILLKAYVLSSSPIQDVMAAFEKMLEKGIQPTGRLYATLLQSACDSGAMGIAEQIFSLAERELAGRGRLEISGGKSLRIGSDGLPINYNNEYESELIRTGEEEEEEDLSISESDLEGEDGEEDFISDFHPSRRALVPSQGADVYHFTIMVNAYLRLGKAEIAKEYLQEMKDRGMKLTNITYGSLVASYVKTGNEGNAQLAKELVSHLINFAPDLNSERRVDPESDLEERISIEDQQKAKEEPSQESSSWDGTDFEALYAPLLQYHARQGDVARAAKVLKDMAEVGIKGSIRTLSSFLDANRRAGDVEQCMEIWESIYSRALAETSFDTNINTRESETFSSLDPSRRNLLCLPLSIYMDALFNSGLQDEIPKVWSRMKGDGFGFDAHNYNALVRSLVKVDRVENAMRVAEEVLTDDLYEEVKEKRIMESRARRDRRAENMKRVDALNGTQDLEGIYETSEDFQVPSLNPEEVEASSSELSTISGDKEYQKNMVSSPSRPPNRRSQNRMLDDIEEVYPIDQLSIGEEPELSDLDKDESATSNITSTRSSASITQALKNRRHELSQWFPHFQTLRVLELHLDSLDRDGRTVQVLSQSKSQSEDQDVDESHPLVQNLTVSDLLRKYPRTAANLRKHRSKVEAIEAQYRADAEKARAWGATSFTETWRDG